MPVFVIPLPEIVHTNASMRLHDGMENHAILRGCCSRSVPLLQPSPLARAPFDPLFDHPLNTVSSRAIVINCLALRDPQHDAAAAAAAAAGDSHTPEAAHAGNQGGSTKETTDASEQR